MSANIVRVNGDYKIQLIQGGTLTLDASNTGNIVVNGNLTVTGTTSTVNTQQTLIEDNVITLNSGQLGTAGVTGSTYSGKAGLDIFRGTAPSDGHGNAQFFWDETISWDDSNTATTLTGGFVLQTGAGGYTALHLNAVGNNNANLTLLAGSTSVITVRGVTDYHTRVLNDNDIPNKKYVDDRVSVMPSDTAGNWRTNPGRAGQLVSISDGTPNNGMPAYWDTTNNRWSYVYNNSAV